MKKKAYTLAEILIAVGIVGVISAIMIPFLSKTIPDTNKITYLKSYNALVKVTKSMARDHSLFSTVDNFNTTDGQYQLTIDNKNYPLTDVREIGQTIDNNPTSYYSGASKYGKLLAHYLNGTITNSTDIDNTGVVQFDTMQNKVHWTVTPHIGPVGSEKITAADIQSYVHSLAAVDPNTGATMQNYRCSWDIMIDVNGVNQSPNSVYQVGMTKTPDRFTFHVSPTAKIRAVDLYGQYYRKSRMSLSKKKPDLSTYIEPADIASSSLVVVGGAGSNGVRITAHSLVRNDRHPIVDENDNKFSVNVNQGNNMTNNSEGISWSMPSVLPSFLGGDLNASKPNDWTNDMDGYADTSGSDLTVSAEQVSDMFESLAANTTLQGVTALNSNWFVGGSTKVSLVDQNDGDEFQGLFGYKSNVGVAKSNLDGIIDDIYAAAVGYYQNNIKTGDSSNLTNFALVVNHGEQITENRAFLKKLEYTRDALKNFYATRFNEFPTVTLAGGTSGVYRGYRYGDTNLYFTNPIAGEGTLYGPDGRFAFLTTNKVADKSRLTAWAEGADFILNSQGHYNDGQNDYKITPVTYAHAADVMNSGVIMLQNMLDTNDNMDLEYKFYVNKTAVVEMFETIYNSFASDLNFDNWFWVKLPFTNQSGWNLAEPSITTTLSAFTGPHVLSSKWWAGPNDFDSDNSTLCKNEAIANVGDLVDEIYNTLAASTNNKVFKQKIKSSCAAVKEFYKQIINNIDPFRNYGWSDFDEGNAFVADAGGSTTRVIIPPAPYNTFPASMQDGRYVEIHTDQLTSIDNFDNWINAGNTNLAPSGQRIRYRNDSLGITTLNNLKLYSGIIFLRGEHSIDPNLHKLVIAKSKLVDSFNYHYQIYGQYAEVIYGVDCSNCFWEFDENQLPDSWNYTGTISNLSTALTIKGYVNNYLTAMANTLINAGYPSDIVNGKFNYVKDFYSKVISKNSIIHTTVGDEVAPGVTLDRKTAGITPTFECTINLADLAHYALTNTDVH